jgi:nifR3 family TIM-barrel protein
MAKAAQIVDEMEYFKVIDLNLGCPVDKIASHKAGSGLLREPDLAEKIFDSVRRVVKKTPLTVKMRIGYNDPSGQEAVEVAKRAEQCGFQAVAVHGRTRAQGYQGKADYEAIRRVKEAVKIPVIGNGDVTNSQSAQNLKRISGCDAIMIGRGALGNPWIYKQIEQEMKGQCAIFQPTFQDKKKTLLEHFDLLVEHYPHTAHFQIRRVAAWYFNGYPGVSDFRARVNRTDNLIEVRKLIEDFQYTSPLMGEVRWG